jgi:short-subunit dehydrogenase
MPMSSRTRYGDWALVVGASEGIGAALADALAARGLDLVLLARRQESLDEVAQGLEERHGVATKTLAIDLTDDDAAARILEAVADLEIGYLAVCAGADPAYRPFLDQPLEAAEAMLRRNCLVLLRLVHPLAGRMAERGRGGILLFSSGAGLVGMPNTAAYGGTKAFDLVFGEGLWAELAPRGVDVLTLVLGETDTPALRRLKAERGRRVAGATPVAAVVEEALRRLGHGPTRMVGAQMRIGERVLAVLPRITAVRLAGRMSARTMGAGPTKGSA